MGMIPEVRSTSPLGLFLGLSMNLSKPEIVRCFFDGGAESPLSAMELRWDDDTPAVVENVWHLPEGVVVKGSAPKRFGISVHRTERNAYHVRVLWNRLSLSWHELTARQILASSLCILLRSLDTEVADLLNQPIEDSCSLAA